MIRTSIVLFATSMVAALYTTFVLTLLWAWFVVPAFHVTEISFWVMYGLTLLIGLLREDDDIWQEQRHGILATMLLACIPAEKRDDVMAQLKEHDESMWSKAGLHIVGRLVANTTALAIGFLVHILSSN